MTLRIACPSLRRVDRILKNGVFTGNFNILPPIQPKCLQSRQFLDGPCFDPPEGLDQPVDLKQNFGKAVGDTVVDATFNLLPVVMDGTNGERGNMKFKKITLFYFAENFLQQRTTVKDITFFRENFARVEMLPGASEDDGKILWFEIGNVGKRCG